MGGVEGPVHTAVTMGPRVAGGGQWDAGWPMQCQQNSTWREIKGRNFGPWSPPLTLRLLLRFLFFLACLSRARFSRPSPIFFRTLLLSSTLCCDQNATWVSLIVFISTSNQANKEWVFHLPFFLGFLGVPLTMELSFWCSFAAGDGMGGAGSVGMGFFFFS